MQVYLAIGLGVLLMLTGCDSSKGKDGRSIDPSRSEIEAVATDAYIFGYPLVTMEMTRRVMTNTETPKGSKAPMGQFANLRHFPGPSFRDVTAPNADTLYSVAWVDLSKEPYILHVPNERGRYYLMPLIDGWTSVFSSIGTRTTGTDPGNYALTGPFWQGTLPSGIKKYRSATNLVWILGRTYSSGTPEDYKQVHEIQDRYSLTPLSAFGKSYSPPNGEFNPQIDMKTPVRDQVNAMDGVTFFNLLTELMKSNPPTSKDDPLIEKMKSIGIIAGVPLDLNQMDPSTAKAIQQAPTRGLEKIMDQEAQAENQVNGWNISLMTGSYGTNYLQRAYVAAIGLGANLPRDAIYPYTTVNGEGNPLTGSKKYVLHFAKDGLPPVKGFWSLTMYNSEYFFVPNVLQRYALGSRDRLMKNLDGSIDLYIQKESPGKENESNWLPAPEGPFKLMLRLYWPQEEILSGSWVPPAVTELS